MTPGFEDRTPDWIPLDEAVERVLRAVEPLEVEDQPLDRALGAVLARPVRAAFTLPPFHNSAMDGYAVRASDVAAASASRPVGLKVVRVLHAGGEPGAPLAPSGEAVRIMTGAPVPPGADSVIRVEDTDAEAHAAGTVRILDARDAGRNIRPAGEDFAEGDVVAPAGARITSGWTGALVAAGVSSVAVHRLPRVAILSSGDELRPAGHLEDVRAGRGIPESNGPMISAAVREAGGLAVPLGIARDDVDDLRSHLAAADDADLLVTLGGASMGEADLMKRVLAELGMTLDFWRVRMRPGSPVSLGRLPRPGRPALPVLGLPGNPASAFVTFQLLGRPCVRRLAGDPRPHQPVARAQAAEPISGAPNLCHCVRVTLEAEVGELWARPAGPQGSGLVSTLGPAHGLAILPEGVETVAPGDPVEVLLLDGRPGTGRPGYRARA